MKSYVLCLTLMVAGVAYIQADTAALPSLDTLLKQTIENLDIGVKKFQEITGIQTEFDKTKLEDYLKKNFGKTQEKIQELINNLQKDSGKYGEEFKKTLDSFIKQFNDTAKQINTPEVQGKITKLQEAFQTGLKKIAEQANEVGKSLGITIPPNVHKTINEIFDELSKSSHKLQEKVNQIVADAQAELKKKKSS